MAHNLAGLISGNLKRHLTKHGIKTDGAYGEDLISCSLRDCEICQRHAEALRYEMGVRR